MVRISSGLLTSLAVSGLLISLAPAAALAKQICHDEQQQVCARHAPGGAGPSYGPHHPQPGACIQYRTITVQVCKYVVDVNPPGLIPQAPRNPVLQTPR